MARLCIFNSDQNVEKSEQVAVGTFSNQNQIAQSVLREGFTKKVAVLLDFVQITLTPSGLPCCVFYICVFTQQINIQM